MKYIVESANWVCSVNLKDDHRILDTEEKRVLEASTQAFELFYKDINNDIEIISILNENGENYVDYIEMDEDGYELPYVLIGMITKCYKSSDKNKPYKHYYILSDYLVKNSGIIFLQDALNNAVEAAFSENPKLKKFITTKFKNKNIITGEM